jgi:anti-sigma regulatory factor (Ser/Thr protein kinase)
MVKELSVIRKDPMSQVCSAVADLSQVGQARREAIRLAQHSGWNDSFVGKVALITTELGMNLVKHATGGELLMRVSESDAEDWFELLSVDRGPGMVDAAKCIVDGYSTTGSPGTGLGAVARIADEFDIYSQVEKGTVAVARIVSGGTGARVGVIHQPKDGEPISGDGWLAKKWEGRTLCAVADGLGHGPVAATAATAIIRALKTMPRTLSPSKIIGVAHDAATSTCGASLGVAILDDDAREVWFAGVGNVSAMVVRGERRNHVAPGLGIVGREYDMVKESCLPWSKESILVMHSDGFSERWDLNRYPGLAARAPSLIAGIMYRDFSRPHDDKTVLVTKGLP